MNRNTEEKQLHSKRIATGQKIFSAMDGPSAEAMSRKMRYDLWALDGAIRNTQNSNAMFKVAHGALESTKTLLTTIKDRAIIAANDTTTDFDRQIIQKEINEFIDQIDNNTKTMYNGKFLIDGSHRRPTSGTVQALTNSQLSEDTTVLTKMVDLQDRRGGILGIKSTDRINISYVKDAKTYSTSYDVSDTTVQDIFVNANAINGDVFDTLQTYNTSFVGVDAEGKRVLTVDGKNALTVHTMGVGVENSVGGLTISVENAQGHIKQTVNESLDAFVETITPRDVSANNTLTTQISEKADHKVEADFNDMSAFALGLKGKDDSTLSVATQKEANAAIKVSDVALQRVSEELTKTGAMLSRLEYTAQNLTVYTENLTAAESTIVDADIAKEMVDFTSADVDLQGSETMLRFISQNANWFMQLMGQV